jgi:hypothetical protein
MLSLKERIFGDTISESQQSIANPVLEDILESLVRQEKMFVFTPEIPVRQEQLEEQELLVEKTGVKPSLLLYEIAHNSYLVYVREENIYSSEKPGNASKTDSYGLFVPSGVVVRRVPQNILGNGVLGRAFIHSSYIEILDSLMGHEYMEVLTHEVLHIMHPEKKEADIRQMTRNYLPFTVYH